MLKKICGACVLLILTNFSQGQLLFDATIEKVEFLEGEKVFCVVTLENTSSHEADVFSLHPETGGLGIEIVDQKSGKELKYSGPLVTTSGKSRVSIGAGQKIIHIIELNSLFGKRLGASAAHQSFSPGKYKVELTYESGSGATLVSSASFTSLRPTGEEAMAYSLLMSAIQVQAGNSEGVRQGAQDLIRLEREHPNSVYTPTGLTILAAWYKFHLKDDQKAIETYHRLVEKYPAGIRIPGALDAALSSIQSRGEKKQFLDRLMNNVRDSIGIEVLRRRPEFRPGN